VRRSIADNPRNGDEHAANGYNDDRKKPRAAMAKRAVKSKPHLRQLQKALTRQRLLDAARKVFYDVGYYDATVDQIVEAAGAGRQTFYFHFADKQQLLAQLVADYNARGAAVMEQLPSPQPTFDQLRTWLLEVAAFLEQDKSTYSVINQLSFHPKTNHSYYIPTAELWINALARRAPAFAAALPGYAHGVKARALAWRLFVDISWACGVAWEQRGTEFAEAVVTDVAQSLYHFLHDPRFDAKVGQSKTKRNRCGT
jgi:AcrR family transcriptional regulator